MLKLYKQQWHQIALQDVGEVKFDEPLSRHNSWKIGGSADIFVEPETVDQVVNIVRTINLQAIPLVVIGQGTNLLFDDSGIRGLVMKIGERMANVEISGNSVSAEGGTWVPKLSRLTMQAGLSGLEHCIGIPGTVGGLVMMNGGSQRRGIGENVINVTVVDNLGQVHHLSQEECEFSYRHSALQGTGRIVVSVELNCPKADGRDVRREMLADLQARRNKFPHKQPSCGSVFLSTAEMHASVGPPGKIIEDSGLKGLRIGQAEVSRQHANFIINLGDATAKDVLTLIRQIRATVREQIGFELDCEVRYVSPDGCIYPAHLKAEDSV
ncbi:MAG: UDP-N-acetylmuramate dehydrogenase [Deltaproteobacteria bacterium]|nr:UDP-N-acetylmuramate dehydrogenase [Deltaproteobacteria bacterium]MCW9050624.1 UDP-N-acetylmuramate dehydrogenase [Deltaproteobacteria bacterium]